MGEIGMRADADTEASVIAVMRNFMEAYAKRDMGALMELYAPDPDVVVIGTGADEKRIGTDEIKAQAERDWSQSEAMTFELEWYTVSAAGPVAWIAADCIVHATIGEKDNSFILRFTAVLEKRGDRWYIMQSHGSAPMSDQSEGKSFPE
jgi:ketosteroid isomerase-like protein